MRLVLPLTSSVSRGESAKGIGSESSSAYRFFPFQRRSARHSGNTRHRPDPTGVASGARLRVDTKASASSNLFLGEAASPTSASASSSSSSSSRHVLLGLTIAGVASTLLTTIFGLFHVDVFLTAYELSLDTYSKGNLVFSVLNTANDLVGGWVVDNVSTTIDRSDMVGMAGCLFCLSFLTPFFRWGQPRRWDSLHFVVSMSLYDTLYSFTAILMGSIISDNWMMSDAQRVEFMASGKVLNLMASLVVARVGLGIFNTNDLHLFRLFLVVVAGIAALLFLLGQELIRGVPNLSFFRALRVLTTMNFSSLRRLLYPWRKHSPPVPPLPSSPVAPSNENSGSNNNHGIITSSTTTKLHWKKVVGDFWKHQNFWAWVVMEMLLEAQVTFNSFFLKTFVDRLLFESGSYSRETCDWFLSIIRPLTQVITILCYVPIQKYGYTDLYRIVFITNFILSIMMILLASNESGFAIALFLLVYPVITGAMQASGFFLVMADMVLEMKRMHALQGRFAEPSLAGLFMGANALFCKPAESLLPVVAATVLQQNKESSTSLYWLLVVPPVICSVVQFTAWHFFSLTRGRTAEMRQELQALVRQQGVH